MNKKILKNAIIFIIIINIFLCFLSGCGEREIETSDLDFGTPPIVNTPENDVNDDTEEEVEPIRIFEKGSIDVNTGEEFDSYNRLRSDYILANSDIYFSNLFNNIVRVYYFDSNKKLLWAKEQIEGRNIQHEGYVRLVLLKEDSSVYSIEEVEHINNNFTIQFRDNELPSYWQEHLSNKCEKIKERWESIKENGDSLMFITDVHYEDNNTMSPLLLNYVYNNTNAKKLFLGGDFFRGHNDKSKSMGMMSSWINLIADIPHYFVAGNHDYNTSISEQAKDKVITEEELYDAYIKDNNEITKIKDKAYYYLDNQEKKIRYYVLNSGDNYGDDSIVDNFDYEEQLNWLKETANEIDSSWNIIVIQHVVFQASTTEVIIDKVGEKLLLALDAIQLDSDMPKIFAVLSGHVHGDQSILTESGYYCISTVTDSMQGGGLNNPTKTIGTTTEQAFDVFQFDLENKAIYATRIGAGEDREWHY